MHDYKPKPLPAFTQSDVNRFWSKVTQGSRDECWPWTGTCAKGGRYGAFWVRDWVLIASRVAFFLGKGYDPAPLLVRHTCDNPWCVNPNHLITGTHKENSEDCISRGRRPRGVGIKTALLNDEIVAKVLQDRVAGLSIQALCLKYGVTCGSIIPIIKGKTWKHVIGPRERQKPHLTQEMREQIREKRKAGATLRELSGMYGMSIGAIGMLCQGVTWSSDEKKV